MLRAMVSDAFACNLHPESVARIDGLLWGIYLHPDSSTYSNELGHAADAAHRHRQARHEACKCGLTPACQSEKSGVRRLAQALMFLDDDDIAELDTALRALERRWEEEAREALLLLERRRQAEARETLEDRVFVTLRRARREMSARELADRVGGDATGQQVGAVLTRLHNGGRVQMIEYQPQWRGPITRHWLAAEWVVATEDDDVRARQRVIVPAGGDLERIQEIMEQLRRLSNASATAKWWDHPTSETASTHRGKRVTSLPLDET